MIKKHLIACSGILVIMLSARLFFPGTPVHDLKSFSQKMNLPFEKVEEKQVIPTPQAARLTFSDEKIPTAKAVQVKMKKYLAAHNYKKLQTGKLHNQAAKWFPIIEPILKAHGIPEDFKYMPLVESGLANGVSPKGAAGYWQFMPGTARNYGLKVNSKVDERRDIYKSTVAACRYLKELHGIFNSWTLAAAAYNIGETNLQRQMAKQGSNNYFKMKLNRETASYVYKLIAMKEIIEDPIKHGYASRGKQLLANKENVPQKKYYIDPRIEQNALEAFSVLKN